MFCKFSINIPVVLELPQEQITTAQDLNSKIQVTVSEAVKSVDLPNVENEAERKALILESNLFCENVNTIIFNLQNVVADLEDGQEEKQELLQVIIKLRDASHAVYNEINKNPQELKIKLKANLELVAAVSADLLKIIEKNKLRGDGKILLNALGDLQNAFDFVKIRNEIINVSPDKIKDYLKDFVTRICTSISTIIFQTDLQGLNSIIDAVINHCRQLAGIIDIFLKQHGAKYAEDVRNLMADTAKELIHAAVGLQKFCILKITIVGLINLVRETVNKICEIIVKLITAVEIGKVEIANEILDAFDVSPMISSRTMKVRH